MTRDDHAFIRLAYQQALKGYNEGGCPIGAVLVNNTTKEILGAGHNQLVQNNSPILHGEMSALQNAGRMASRENCTLYTTLSPCMMCAGTIVQFAIPRVVIGDTVNASGNEDFLKKHDVNVIILNDAECIALTKKFRNEKPDLWLEDWGGPRRQQTAA